MTHVIYKLNFKNEQYLDDKDKNSNADSERNQILHDENTLNVKSDTFFELFPFHLVFRRNMEIISIGFSLSQAMKHVEGESLKDLFNLVRPFIEFTWDKVMKKISAR